jgi:hypothetical protein
MTASEVEAVDTWSFANRIRSRGEAIRRLVSAGLQTLSDERPAQSVEPEPNSD